MKLSVLNLISAILITSTSTVLSQSCTSEDRIAGAIQYVNATVSASPEDAAAVPLAKDCVRFETFDGVGPIQTGVDADSIRASLVAGPQAFTVNGVKSADFVDAGNGTIISHYVLNAGIGDPLNLTLTTAGVFELFTYPTEGDDQCEMVEITARVTIPAT